MLSTSDTCLTLRSDVMISWQKTLLLSTAGAAACCMACCILVAKAWHAPISNWPLGCGGSGGEAPRLPPLRLANGVGPASLEEAPIDWFSNSG